MKMTVNLYFTAVVINCLLFVPATAVSAKHTRFVNAGLDDLAFTSNVLFIRSCRSISDCARHCSGDAHCLAFTYLAVCSSPMSCRGFSVTFTSTTSSGSPATGAKTYKVGKTLPFQTQFPKVRPAANLRPAAIADGFRAAFCC